MKYRVKIIAILVLMSAQAYSQNILPATSAVIDRKMAEQCRNMVDDINSMSLKCDTILFDNESGLYRFKGIYFDRDGRLRKYFWCEGGDGQMEPVTMSGYYDEKGDLVHIAYESSYDCGDDKESYYVHKSLIVDFACEINCDCCDTDLTEKEINKMRPVTGTVLTKAIANDMMSFKNFIRADILQNVLKSKEYEENKEYGRYEFQ